MMMRKGMMTVVFLTLGLVSLTAQTPSVLDQGKAYYDKGDYLSALTVFQKLVADPDARSKSDPYLWLAKTYFALLDYSSASRNVEYFIQNYPKDPNIDDASYLQSRILFAENEYDKAVQAFAAYLNRAPEGEQVSNALFWMAESAFALGHYDEASNLYNRVIKGYPTSYKVEASRYRLAVIDLRQREEELLKLLRWSHTEALNAADEFQRREKAYQQALLSYQKKLLDLQSGSTGTQIQSLQDEMKQKDALINALKVQLATGNPKATMPVIVDETILTRILELKARALDLKAFYLDWKDNHGK